MRLLGALNTLGYAYVTALAPPPRFSGVLIAARCPFLEHHGMGGGLSEPYRLVRVEFAAFPHLHAKPPRENPLLGGADHRPVGQGRRAPSARRRFPHPPS